MEEQAAKVAEDEAARLQAEHESAAEQEMHRLEGVEGLTDLDQPPVPLFEQVAELQPVELDGNEVRC